LGRPVAQINKDIAAIDKKLKGDLSAEERQKLEGQRNTLQTELNANKIVGAWLTALHSVGEAKDLKLSDLKVSTDPRADFTEMYKAKGYSEAQINKAFENLYKPMTGATVLEGQIYILTTGLAYRNAGGFELPGFGKIPASDLNIYGASIIGHERYHKLFGPAEPPAYKEGLRILMKFSPNVIVNKQWIDALKTSTAKSAANP
jgi:hypothetical protein